ncbi:HEAT repeat domain-containing protein [Spirillospora sp. CA-108201]
MHDRVGGPPAGLDDVDWAGLDHAHGSAGDVPDLLRALSSADEDEREAALGELFTNIFHQGSRYEASAAAVPFLLALASDPGIPERTWPLYLAAALAIGYDEAHLPSGVAITAWREEAARLRETDPAAEANEQEHRDRAYERDHFDLAWARRSAEAELAAYDAVRAGLLDGQALLPRLRERLAGAEPLSRWAAAIALARLGAADAPVIAELAASSASSPETDADAPGVAYLEGDPRLYSALALAALEEAPPDAVDAVLDGLSRTSGEASFPMAEAALRLTFRTPALPLPRFADLAPGQQRTVRTIAGLPSESRRWGNLLEILRAWGLPTVQDECRRYAGLA